MHIRRAEILPSKNGLPIYHLGPDLSHGPLPALFYFALSGQDSLELAPYNQPVDFLQTSQVRVFSLTIPGHGPGLNNNDALKHWAASYARGEDPIADFIDLAIENIEFLVQSGFINPNKMAAAGLSRGAFIATHLAAKEKRIAYLLGFAPLTKLEMASEFEKTPDAARKNLDHLIPLLLHKKIRFYIGNLDTRVHTEECFAFIHALAESANKQRMRSLNFELNVVPSIGHKGHGTSPETFQNGINWLKANMEIL